MKTKIQKCLIVAIILGTSSLIADAADWTNWNNRQSLGSFYAVAGTAKETVAVGIDGLIATRNNASGIWTTHVFGSSLDFNTIFRSITQHRMPKSCDPDFRAIVYAKNQYVVVRESGLIMTSPDGINWTNGDSGCSISFYSFSYSGMRYVAVGNDGIRISSDSFVWKTPKTAPISIPFTACTWTGTEFLACGLGLDKKPTIYTSPEGDVWTLRDTTVTASLRAAT